MSTNHTLRANIKCWDFLAFCKRTHAEFTFLLLLIWRVYSSILYALSFHIFKCSAISSADYHAQAGLEPNLWNKHSPTVLVMPFRHLSAKADQLLIIFCQNNQYMAVKCSPNRAINLRFPNARQFRHFALASGRRALKKKNLDKCCYNAAVVPVGVKTANLYQHVHNQHCHVCFVHHSAARSQEVPLQLWDAVKRSPAVHALSPAFCLRSQASFGSHVLHLRQINTTLLLKITQKASRACPISV